MIRPQTPYKDIKAYVIGIPGREKYRFYTMASADGVLMWMPDSEQQHVNPQFRDNSRNNPVRLIEVDENDVVMMLLQIISFQTKEIPPLETILEERSGLVRSILKDLEPYRINHAAY